MNCHFKEGTTMKKALLIMSALLALVACNKETPVKESAIDPSKIVFNINVENGEATKGVKTTWENGDDVYVFFQDNTTQYVKMTFDGSSWTYKDKDEGTDFSGLTLATSGKKLSAVYMPNFVCSAAPTYDTDKWTFGDIQGYYQKAEAVSYTVTSTSDIATLSATISLDAPSGISQIFIPTSEYAALGSGEEYVLTATHFIQFSFRGVAPGGTVTQGNMSNGFPLPAFAGTLNGETGLYFWGILEAAGTYDFDFQLVKQNAEKKYAISSKSKSKKNITVPARFAAKLTGLTDNGNFVSLGYTGGPLWATGNLSKTNSKIVDPLEAGEYFRYGKTTPYSASESDYTGMEDPLPTSVDVAYSVNTTWRIPTIAQFAALIAVSNTNTTEHSKEWKTGWTNIGTTKGGRLITSKVNGISLFFAAAGDYDDGYPRRDGEGLYWSSTPYNSDRSYHLFFNNEDIYTYGYHFRYCGFPVRPVKP